MTRFTRPAGVELSLELVGLPLQIGPMDDGLTEEDLAVGWSLFGAELMGEPRRLGTRPWGYWRFEHGQNPPEWAAGVVRLAELGELRDEEVAELAERASVAKTRVYTPAEHYGPNYYPDREAIEVYERVCEVRREALP